VNFLSDVQKSNSGTAIVLTDFSYALIHAVPFAFNRMTLSRSSMFKQNFIPDLPPSVTHAKTFLFHFRRGSMLKYNTKTL